MIEKAGRTSKKILKFWEKEAQEELKNQTQESRKYGEAWRAISNTEFAKLFIEKCEEIKESAYTRITEISLSNLDEVDGDNLKSIIRAMQQRVIVIDEFLDTFIPKED